MSSRLQRLGARLLGRAPALAPRLPARFEGAPGPAPAGQSDAFHPARVPPPPAPSVPPAAPAPALRSATESNRPLAPGRTPPPVDRPRVTDESSLPDRAPESRPAAPASAAPPREAFSRAKPIEQTTIALPPPAAPPAPRSAPAEPSTPPRDPGESSRENPPSPSTRDEILTKRDLASELQRLRTWMAESTEEAPAPTAPTTPASLLPRVVARAQTPSIPRTPPAAVAPVAPPSPTIEINIGTIVVRATTPPAPRAVPVEGNQAAGLHHFLARRGAGLP